VSSPVTVPPAVDRRQPWLGLASYSETDSELFFGREKESLDLLRLVRREVLTVLFGPSGTGKTSLLNAGLFPRLRESGFLPIAIRLDHSGGRPDYIGQIRAFIAAALHADAARPFEEEALAPPQAEQETLWEYLHRVVFWDWRNNPATPVLVFDQFEEIFTLGGHRPAREEFLAALADLVENYIPAAVRLRLDAPGEALPFPHGQPESKVVLSLREDFVSRLDGLRRAMPSVMHNRFAIARMNGEQALLAVREPGRGIVEGPVAGQIVSFVAATQSRGAADAEDVHLASLQVDPALLSVICRELNARRIEQGSDRITEDLLEQAGTNILNDFYERGFGGLNPAVRIFVEDRLLTASGFRSTVPLEEATQAGITAEDIRTLVDRRLIRAEERLGIPHLELTHDLLTKVVQKSRGERQEREQRERERQQRETEERERTERDERQRAELRRARRLLAAVSVAAMVCLLLGLLAFRSYQRAEAAHNVADAATSTAKREKRDADIARDQAKASEKKAKEKETDALTAAAEAAKQREIANREARSAQTALARSNTQDAARLVEPELDRPGQALAYLARALQSAPDSLAARSWVSDLLLNTRWWLSGAPLQHENRVLSAAFSRDGRRVVTASVDRTARVWEADTGKPVGAPLQHQGAVNSAAFSPAGRRVVTASSDTTARVWEADTGKPVGDPLPYRNGSFLSAAFSADGRRVVTASSDNTARIWEADTGKLVGVPLHHQNWVNSAAFSPDGRRVVTASFDATARVWEADTGKPVGTLQHQGRVNSAAFCPDGRRVVTASSDNTARVWDADTAKLVGVPLHHQNRVLSAAFSPDGRRVVTASDDNTARVWEADTSKPLGAPLQHQGGVNTVAFSPDGRRVVTASDDNTARVWEADAGKPFGASVLHQGVVSSAAFSPDGHRVVIASGNRVQVWEADIGKPAGAPFPYRSVGSVGPVVSAVFSPDGRRVATASGDSTARVWDANTAKLVGVPLQHQDAVNSVAFSPDGRRVVTASDDNTAQVWEADTGKPVGAPLQHRNVVDYPRVRSAVYSAIFSPDGRRVVTASSDRTARVWEAGTGTPVGAPLQHQNAVNSAAFSPDGRRVVTASSDHTARVWEADTGKPVSALQHQDVVNSAAFSPDGRRVVTASSDNTARVWEADTGKPVGTPLQHRKGVHSASFSSDGRRVVTASSDNTARVWEADTGKPVDAPLQHQGIVVSASFSPDGRRVVTVSYVTDALGAVYTASPDNSARVWEVLLGSGSRDEAIWLADLAELVGGYRVSELGSLVPLEEPERFQRLRRLARPTAAGKVDFLLRRFFPDSR